MASNERDTPQRGDVWLVAFGAGHIGEPGKNRPAVVVSTSALDLGSIYDLTVVMPISSTVAPAVSRPPVPANDTTGLERDSVIMPRAIRGVAQPRFLQRLGKVNEETLTDAGIALSAILDLS